MALTVMVSGSALGSSSTPGQDLVDEYIDAWSAFYPSRAFAYGDAAAATKFETYAEAETTQWLTVNATTARKSQTLLDSDKLTMDSRLDLQVLLRQAQDELANWREDQPVTAQPQWYAEQVSQALTHLLVRDQLSEQVRMQALVERLNGVAKLCRSGVQKLNSGNALRSETALHTLADAREFFSINLLEFTKKWPSHSEDSSLQVAIKQASSAIEQFEQHIRDSILPKAANSPGIGTEPYAAKLARRTSELYTPAQLLSAASHEMLEVRELMNAEAARWYAMQANVKPNKKSPSQILDAALDAMESERQDNRASFLESFATLTFAVERFVREQKIATVAKPTTLNILLSPSHFSGAAVGGVYPAGPFSPQSDTLFYVPSIADSAPVETKNGFYRSFNDHFNTMIMSHEMFRGHYLQYKVAITKAPAVRSLFANGSYVEGWGSFSEELMLDAGWADESSLTRLAHLRKRLENATRAVVSVQVNTAGWLEPDVLEFAQREGLLAPQFAKNLWQRVINSPLQITDYFTGYRHFKTLFANYQTNPRKGSIKDWVDRILQIGPVPPVLLEGVL